MQPFFQQSAESGRIRITLSSCSIGPDLLVTLTGGSGHIGAVSMESAAETFTWQAQGHREGDLAGQIGSFLASGLNCRVVVLAGIHFDAITRDEIRDVLNLAESLAESLIAEATKGDSVLTLEQLNEFEKLIRSGRLEAEFRCGSEEERLKTLELLEKLMDVAELADEAATRLIFRGIPPITPSPQ